MQIEAAKRSCLSSMFAIESLFAIARRDVIVRRLAKLLTVLFFLSGSALADEQIDYLKHIKPILAARCYACHGALKQEQGLRLDTVEFIKQGGDTGPGIVVGRNSQSLIVQAVTGSNGSRMPPEDEFDPLELQQIESIKTWIDQGALGPADEQPQKSPAEHWAFKSPVRAPLPSLQDTGWTRNPIDVFLAARHEEVGLSPNDPASKPVLLRRVYLDLIGLPPTRVQLHAFLNDDSPRAYEHVVERLLASAQHGERWGRHWMDVWRYSDWYGSEGADRITNSQRHIWRWRDWIIESLNEDKGYDQMVIEMLAGDEIAPSDPEIVRATGYLARNHFRLDSNVPLTMSVEHTSRAFLGLTFECSRCHDHKYDPLSQRDFYRFRAFFEPMGIRLDRVPGNADIYADGLARVYDAKPDAPTYLYLKGDERRPDKEHPLSAGVPTFFETVCLDGESLKFQKVYLEPEEFYPALRAHFGRDEVQRLQGEIGRLTATLHKWAAKGGHDEGKYLVAQKQRATFSAKLSATRACLEAELAKYGGVSKDEYNKVAMRASAAQRVASICEAEERIVETKHRIEALREKSNTDNSQLAKLNRAQQDLEQYTQQLVAAEQSKPTTSFESLGDVHPATSTGRRTALARWLVGPRNPLTARVAINHIWMRHFGEPLVPTVFDFGQAGQPPTHPKLLDWLAAEFVDHGWSMKHIHKLIVTSSAYRMRSTNAGNTVNRAADEDNRYLWRMNPSRMEAELIRDGLLYLVDRLDQALGGADIPVEQANSFARRSIYLKHSGVDRMKVLQLFDSASVIECYRRRESVVPQQALALSNSQLSLNTSRLIARTMSVRCKADTEFVGQSFETVLGRRPSAAELDECVVFLREHSALLQASTSLTRFGGGTPSELPPSADPKQRARESLILVLLNHNDFVTIR